MKCRHCQHKEANRPKGLCWTCYYTPAVRGLYPSTSHLAPRSGNGWKSEHAELPDCPTDALPGSPEKEAVLTERASRSQTLWHPDDRIIEGGPL